MNYEIKILNVLTGEESIMDTTITYIIRIGEYYFSGTDQYATEMRLNISSNYAHEFKTVDEAKKINKRYFNNLGTILKKEKIYNIVEI